MVDYFVGAGRKSGARARSKLAGTTHGFLRYVILQRSSRKPPQISASLHSIHHLTSQHQCTTTTQQPRVCLSRLTSPFAADTWFAFSDCFWPARAPLFWHRCPAPPLPRRRHHCCLAALSFFGGRGLSRREPHRPPPTAHCPSPTAPDLTSTSTAQPRLMTAPSPRQQ